MSDCCPVCEWPAVATWEIEPGTRPNGEPHTGGTGYVHSPGTLNTAREYRELGEEVFDGDACYAFVDGTTERDGYPPQPRLPEIDTGGQQLDA